MALLAGVILLFSSPALLVYPSIRRDIPDRIRVQQTTLTVCGMIFHTRAKNGNIYNGGNFGKVLRLRNFRI